MTVAPRVVAARSSTQVALAQAAIAVAKEPLTQSALAAWQRATGVTSSNQALPLTPFSASGERMGSRRQVQIGTLTQSQFLQQRRGANPIVTTTKPQIYPETTAQPDAGESSPGFLGGLKTIGIAIGGAILTCCGLRYWCNHRNDAGCHTGANDPREQQRQADLERGIVRDEYV